ncbi:ABC transporter permease [Gemmatimonas sp.]|jgi:peptide/nickel transport system permease protein|uniref:ABC transporter permease n=1 Tax=Gemmatimonas sp. TaxID=1962908 RepID=UPI0037C0017E
MRRRSPAFVLIALLVLVVAAGPLLSPYAPNAQLDIIALRSQAPSLAHPFGTDAVSRDVLSRVLDGGRVSLALAILSVALSLVVGTLYGALSTLAGGLVDTAMRRLLEVALSIPRLLVLLAVGALWGTLSFPALVLLIGFTGWFDTARLVTDELRGLSVREFTLAARAIGVRGPRLLWRHLLPHLLPTLVINASFGVAGTIALEAGLSYLGLGIQAPQASWGTILRDGAGVVQSEWWLSLFPGLATVLAVLACNALGDALRERFAWDHVHSLDAAPTGGADTASSPAFSSPRTVRP